jgi:hypothetical protein
VTQFYPQALGSLFVASYDSQGYGGGIRTRLHTGLSEQLYILVALYDINYTLAQKYTDVRQRLKHEVRLKTEGLPKCNYLAIRGIHIQTHRLMEGIYEFAIEMGSGGMTCISSFIEIG